MASVASCGYQRDTTECGDCKQSLPTVTITADKGRVLQCGHCFCVNCLNNKLIRVVGDKKTKLHVCSLCNLGISMYTSAWDLPIADNSLYTNNDLLCALCDAYAVCFCTSPCQQKLCLKHKQVDEKRVWSTDLVSHDHVSLEYYVEQKEKFVRKKFCRHHYKREITLACRECLITACISCDQHAHKKEKADTHIFEDLNVITKQVADEAAMFRSVVKRIKPLIELVKEKRREFEGTAKLVLDTAHQRAKKPLLYVPGELRSLISRVRMKYESAESSLLEAEKLDLEVYLTLKSEFKSSMLENYAAKYRQRCVLFIQNTPTSVELPKLSAKIEGVCKGLYAPLGIEISETLETCTISHETTTPKHNQHGSASTSGEPSAPTVTSLHLPD